MTTVPQSKPGSRMRRPPIAIIVAVILVIALVAVTVTRQLTSRPADPFADATVVAAARADLTLGISATGQVEPRVQSELAFTAGGLVSAVLVAEGDPVAAGQPLVELSTRQLAAEVAAAEAAVAVAQADLAAVQEGATTEEIAEAQAQVAAASGALTQTQGSVTDADLRAARAAVEEARVALAELQAGPDNDERVRAESALAEAGAELERQRSALATAKEQARANIDLRANQLRDAQSTYSTAYWDLQHVTDKGTDPRSGRPLSDTEERDFAAALDEAARRLADAEAALAQAQIDYETAKQNEVSGLATAQARVDRAQADLDALFSGAEADELASARARLARAQADLASLTSAGRSGAIAAQAANVEAAQARLAQVTADPKASDIARAQARLAQAEAQLEQARVRLDEAILKAPFAGVVATVNVAPGESVGAQTTPVVLIDVTRYLVRVTVDEVDIASVAPGQQVDVLIDALGAPALTGTVQRVEPLPQDGSGVTAYRVTVEVDPGDRALKPGMTASATIVADKRSGVVAVPVAALSEQDGKSIVRVATTGADGARQVTEREVQVGLRTAEQVEIVSGLAEGEQVIIP